MLCVMVVGRGGGVGGLEYGVDGLGRDSCSCFRSGLS
jgi:hypothetical protein